MNGVEYESDDFLFGAWFALQDGWVATGQVILPSTTVIDMSTSSGEDTNFWRARISTIDSFWSAYSLSLALNVDFSAINYGYTVKSITYTPTSVPEPATWSLLMVGAAAAVRS